MHKKSRAGKETGARSGARTGAAHPSMRTKPRNSARATFSHMPKAVGDILFRGLSQLRDADPTAARSGSAQPLARARGRPNAQPEPQREQHEWLDWIRALLPCELAAHLVHVLPKAGAGPHERELVLFADSPAWCARLRYALLEIEQQIRAREPAIRRTRARVLMLKADSSAVT